jgi:TonB family protein
MAGGTGKKEWGIRMSTFGNPLFSSIQSPLTKSRWESFAAGYAVQAIGLAALVVFTILAPKISPPLISQVELVAPDLALAPQARTVKPVAHPVARLRTPPPVAATPAPRIAPPVLPMQRPQRIQAVAPVAEIAQPRILPAPKFDSAVLNAIPGPRLAATKIVVTNTFGGSSAAPTLHHVAPSRVQTGGFGDPNGVATNAHGSNRPTIAATGSFDLPQGKGYGNGSRGAAGLRGTVASAGFGNAEAIQGGGGRGGNAAHAHLEETSFTSTTAPAPEARHLLRAVNRSLISAPVSIQSKPTPVYTSQARQLKVEGEVLLNVVFTANGQIRILNVVRGLGYGLDEAAKRAAQGIRFTPAMRDGHPVDSNATLHIVFQLS